MRIVRALAVLSSALLVFGCSDQIRDEDYEPGPSGEPHNALEAKRVYTKQFTVTQNSYVLALGHIHSYLVSESYWITYTPCFNQVPKTVSEGREKQVPSSYIGARAAQLNR